PKEKGSWKNRYAFGHVELLSGEGDDCGTYQLPPSLDQFDPEAIEIAWVSIQHDIYPIGEDYWTFGIKWDDPANYEWYSLRVVTNEDSNSEGTLSDEGWVVDFEAVEANLYSSWSPVEPVWTEFVTFTMRITREPHVTP
ncbi:MAG: hypothetical protein NWF10_04450, partial [Candidatus Bathyarchaeota archaeon]|nr:hypothetical protein [Candidatus Bathyarchaeota archaeon]